MGFIYSPPHLTHLLAVCVRGLVLNLFISKAQVVQPACKCLEGQRFYTCAKVYLSRTLMERLATPCQTMSCREDLKDV